MLGRLVVTEHARAVLKNHIANISHVVIDWHSIASRIPYRSRLYICALMTTRGYVW